MLFSIKKKSAPKNNSKKKEMIHKKKKDYLLEDPSIRNEAHTKWEAEDIYDEEDFCDK